MVERRSEIRHSGMVSGLILLPKGGVIDCFLQDWSEGGAHLLVAGTTNIADSFDLDSTPLRRRRLAEVVWRRSTELGVRFRLPEVLTVP